MNRSIIGAAILILLLALGIGVQQYMDAAHGPITDSLEAAAAWSLGDDWEQAAQAADTARQGWEKSRGVSTSLADHEPMEDVDALFARLEVYAYERDAGEFAACCRELARRTEAMADAHRLTWSNVF